MKFGFVPTEGGLRYRETLEEVRLAEQVGLDSVWLSEHHFGREHYWGSPLLGLAGFAAATERLTLGANVAVLPFYHPIRLAEEAHLLQIMSDGRFVLGVGMGYREDEYGAYGVEVEGRGRRYEEALELLGRLLRENEVTFEGRYYRAHGVTIEPKFPRGVPLWAGGWGEQNLRRAAAFTETWIPGPTADLSRLLSCKQTLERYRAEAGRPAAPETPLTRELLIAENDDQAQRDAEQYLLPNYRDEYGGGWRHPLIGQEGSRVADLAALGAERFIIGGPETVIAGIRRYVEQFGTDHLIVRLGSATTPHDYVMRELELLGEHVLPELR